MSAATEARPETESPKRQGIIAAASELFMHQGYGATSMDAIARAAGVSKATLYAYFPSKDVLFATIIQEACRANMAVEDFLPDNEADLAAALTALGGKTLRFLLEERALSIHRVVIAESIRFPELGRAFYDNGPAAFSAAFSAWLVRQHALGRLEVPDPVIASDQFIGLLKTGLYSRATLGLMPKPTEAAIDAAVAAAVGTFLAAYGVRHGGGIHLPLTP